MEIKIENKLLKNGVQKLYLNGNIVYLFGHNGAGKTTILRNILSSSTKINWFNISKNHKKRKWVHYDTSFFMSSINDDREIILIESDDLLNIVSSPILLKDNTILKNEFHIKYDNNIKTKEEFDQIKHNLEIKINTLTSKYIPSVSVTIEYSHEWTDFDIHETWVTPRLIFLKLKNSTPLSNFSTGERKMISLIFFAFNTFTTDSLVLLDEPFASLHEKSIKDLIRLLDDISNLLNCRFLISSHTINAIDYSKLENIVTIVKENGLIKILNSANHNMFDSKNPISSLPGAIKHFSFDATLETFFSDKIIIVEGFSDKFYFDAFLKGQWQVKQSGGKDNIIKTILESSWHAKKIIVFYDGDVEIELRAKIDDVVKFIKKYVDIDILVHNTDEFCDFKESDMEVLMYGKKVEDEQKTILALQYKLSNSVDINSEKFKLWLSKIKSK